MIYYGLGMGKLKRKNTVVRWLARYKFYFMIPASFICLFILSGVALLLPVSPQSKASDVVVTVPLQASAGQAGKILQQNKLVRSAVAFSLFARWKGKDGQIKAGEYKLNGGLSTPQILAELIDGRLVVQTFTIPEGFTTAQIADLLVNKGLINRERFYGAVVNYNFNYPFIQGLPKNEKRLEGYLFPDTYQVTRRISESSIIELMLNRFEKEIDELDYLTLAREAGLTLHQAVTIASLVEREAKIEEEKPLIAGVIYNRLSCNMPLQVDATVQYALGANKPQLSYKDLEVNSPYNTYLMQGLPPGPIAVPGKSSLLAAVHPVVTGDFYYVAKPDGYHAFARTLAEHNANKERYLQ
ncbi:endolytic transglycosylase MltG [Pelotomaculum isophthalicicum JI]|uniref:Endolytic murein transglycosylase n=1 Tax=Pelotomaculum isophthalicicum JI TaxID=947010 RepID=A0A9X4GYI7_9FIRM|nr:endolytic transglycosylase MltG [Pelotomaculum isophthalicicum]MDF9407822.1 endolytic transglycosylase MltG [Pelotomaculum isophthalicicum JI]